MTETGKEGKFIRDIRRARREGRLPREFRKADLQKACPGWAAETCGVFPSKHRVGNPGRETELFVRVARGLYRLVEDA